MTFPAAAQGIEPGPSLELLFTIRGYGGYPDFQSPACFFVDDLTGKIYVVDASESEVFVYDHRGAPVRTYGIDKSVKGVKSVIARKDNLYILHKEGVLAVNQNTERSEVLAMPQDIPDGARLGKLLVDGRGEFYVMDVKNDFIYRFRTGDVAGNESGEVFIYGSEEGKRNEDKVFNGLRDIYIDKWDRLSALDAEGNKVKRFDSSGKFMGSLLKRYSLDRVEMFNPALIASDISRRSFIYDEGDRSIKIFDDVGFYKGKIDSVTRGGEFVFLFPKQMFIDSFNRLYLLDDGDRTLKVFEIKGIM